MVLMVGRMCLFCGVCSINVFLFVVFALDIIIKRYVHSKYVVGNVKSSCYIMKKLYYKPPFLSM